MRQHMKISVAFFAAAIAFASCTKEVNEVEIISDETLSQIAALGFSTKDVQKIDEGYLVEGDIILTSQSLSGNHQGTKLRIAEVEQYRTFNLVNTGSSKRNISVSTSGSVNAEFSQAVDDAIARYNAENLNITFSRVSNNGNIVIKIVNTGQYIASAGFPDSQGNPYPEVKYAKRYSTYSNGFMTTVIAHELGHCIGFRHTDYMNRAFSCGSGGNEGQVNTGVGAVHIQGTPTGPDAASWMLACLSSTTNRPFNSNDKIALGYIY